MMDESEIGKSLVSLALIESRIEENRGNKDRLSLFLPFVVDAVLSMGDTAFTRADAMDAVKRRSGIALPDTVVSALLRRMVRRREIVRKNGSYERTDVKIPFNDIVSKKQDIEDSHSLLIDSMLSYVEANSINVHGKRKIRKALAAYLDFHFKSLANHTLDEGADSDRPGDVDWVGRYLIWAQHNEPSHFETAVILVRGRIIYDAAFLPGFAGNQQSLNGLVVYLDSPVICRALGYHSEDEERLAKQAIDTLKHAGVSCRVFDRTVSEIARVLAGVCERWDTKARFERLNTYDFFMAKRGYTRSDVERIASDPEIEIQRQLGLRVLDAPKRKAEYTSDEVALSKMLKRPDGDLSDLAIWHDVDCVAAILTLREGRNATTLSRAGCFFATESYLTIRNVSIWWDKNEHRSDFPPIFSLVDLANLAWLYSDTFSKGDYGKESLIAACAASMSPSEEVWKLFSDKLMRLVDEKEIGAEAAAQYLYSMDSRSILTTHEISQEEMENESNKIIHLVTSEVDKAFAKKLNSERELAIELSNASNKRLSEEIAEIRRKARQHEEEREREERRRKANTEARLKKLAKKGAIWTIIFLYCTLAFVFICSLALQVILDKKALPSLVVAVVCGIIAVIPLHGAARERIEQAWYKHYKDMLLGKER